MNRTIDTEARDAELRQPVKRTPRRVHPLRRPAGERAGSELARARSEPGEVEQSAGSCLASRSKMERVASHEPSRNLLRKLCRLPNLFESVRLSSRRSLRRKFLHLNCPPWSADLAIANRSRNRCSGSALAIPGRRSSNREKPCSTLFHVSGLAFDHPLAGSPCCGVRRPPRCYSAQFIPWLPRIAPQYRSRGKPAATPWSSRRGKRA